MGTPFAIYMFFKPSLEMQNQSPISKCSKQFVNTLQKKNLKEKNDSYIYIVNLIRKALFLRLLFCCHIFHVSYCTSKENKPNILPSKKKKKKKKKNFFHQKKKKKKKKKK